jgi:hypothetical protein
MADRIQAQGRPAAEVILGLAGHLALRANAMVTQGHPREEVANWVRDVETAFRERLDEMLIEVAEK